MKSKELLKFNEIQSLVEITKTDGVREYKEYCVCSCYDDTKSEGSKWCWGHYFTTMESALKYIALDCFSKIKRWALLEITDGRLETYEVFDDENEAKKSLKERYENYSQDSEVVSTYEYEEYDNEYEITYSFDSDLFENLESVTRLKLIEIIV